MKGGRIAPPANEHFWQKLQLNSLVPMKDPQLFNVACRNIGEPDIDDQLTFLKSPFKFVLSKINVYY